MFKTYMRLLGFARPIKKYAIPYGIYSLLYALFNSLTFMLIIPILNTMFDDGFSPEYVEKLPPVELNQEYLTTLFNYTYSHLFDTYDRQNVLLLLAAVAIIISFLSNLFRYLGSWTIENMRTRTLQKMRNEMFSRVMDMNVGYFSDQRKGDIISKITSDVGVVQFCITNTLQVSFREPFLIVGYIVMMIAISWELAIFSVLSNIAYVGKGVFNGMAQAAQPILSTSYGAGRYDRVRAANRCAMTAAAIFSTVIYLILVLCAGFIMPVFVEPSLVPMGIRAMRLYFLAFPFTGLNTVMMYAFQSLEKVRYTSVIAVLRGVVLISAALMLFSVLWGETGVWLALFAAEFSTYAVFTPVRSKVDRSLNQAPVLRPALR